MVQIQRPFYPIIYVRGYAFSQNEVEDTVSDPYMGFNVGSTKLRTIWTGDTERYYFESPLVRLMKDFGYKDVYSAGLDLAAIEEMPSGTISPNSIIIYRYYDLVSSVFGHGKQVGMDEFGRGLGKLITTLRDRVCGDDAQAKNDFKVYLVGHSMGGLVIRTFLQNDKIGDKETKNIIVDKVFTYATPHNGIELNILGNLPGLITLNSISNFSRDTMRDYLGLPPKVGDVDEVNSLNANFDPDRFFCLVGTNSKDYLALRGLSTDVVGPFSDGLVRMNNAVVHGPPVGQPKGKVKLAPRAYVHRSHSGYFGIVNSEEGFQNLTRFLFGDIRVDGELDIESITLPKELEAARKNEKKIRASYHFECVARVRGSHWDLNRRIALENSTIFRTYAELFPDKERPGEPARKNHSRPELFTAYLFKDDKKVKALADPERPSLGFTVDLGVLVPDYTVDDILWLKDHFPGGYIYRDKINLETIPDPTGGANWTLKYGFDSKTPNRTNVTAMPQATPSGDGLEFSIPIEQKAEPGIKASLVLTARWWNV
jgi:PGAP1-like protein